VLKAVFFGLLSHLAVGLVLILLFVSFKQAGKGFFRFHTLLALGLLAGALLAYPHEGFRFSRIFQDHAKGFLEATAGWSLLLFVLCGLLILAYNFSPVSYRNWLLVALAALGSAAVIGDATTYVFPGPRMSWELWLRPVSAILSSVTLGSVLLSMTLGHWCLVVPQLSVSALRKMSLIFFSALALRALFLVLTLLAYHSYGGADGAQTTAGLLDLSRWGTLFVARAGFGIVGPLALVYFIWDTVKIRSTQSATGILYIAVFLVLIGETFSRFLFLFTSISV